VVGKAVKAGRTRWAVILGPPGIVIPGIIDCFARWLCESAWRKAEQAFHLPEGRRMPREPIFFPFLSFFLFFSRFLQYSPGWPPIQDPRSLLSVRITGVYHHLWFTHKPILFSFLTSVVQLSFPGVPKMSMAVHGTSSEPVFIWRASGPQKVEESGPSPATPSYFALSVSAAALGVKLVQNSTTFWSCLRVRGRTCKKV
jgi:hypothetical protein